MLHSEAKEEIIKKYLREGNEFKKQNKLEQSIEKYLKILSIKSNYIPALTQLSVSYQREKKYDLAINCLEQILQLRPQAGNIEARLALVKNLASSQNNSRDIYIKIWNFINQHDLKKKDKKYPLDIPEIFLREYFTQKSRYRIVNLKKYLTKQDQEFLEEVGLSLHYLRLNQKSLMSRSELDKENCVFDFSLEGKPRRNLSRIETVTQFQLAMLKEGEIHSICPNTGKLISSNRSFLAGRDFCYRFVGKEVYYLLVGDVWAEKAALYFPRIELIVKLFPRTTLKAIDSINHFKSYVVSNWKQVFDYIINPVKPEKVVILKNKHFAHHLWNELSGIQKIYEANLLEEVDRFIFVNEPLGKIDNIYREIIPSKVDRTGDLSSLRQKLTKNNYFIVSLGHAFIKEELAQRVYQYSLKQCSDNIIDTVKKAKSKHSFLFWASIRLGKRTWVSQDEGIAYIISKLWQKYPNLGVVIDGFSLPVTNNEAIDPSWLEIIEQEKQVFNKIKSLLPSEIGIYSAIGCSIHESILWANNINVYLAHQGSIQHKVAWFANNSGVIHTKKAILNQPFSFRPGTWERENGIKPVYISESSVRDIKQKIFSNGKAIEAPESFTNYECDYEAVYQEVLKLCKQIKIH